MARSALIKLIKEAAYLTGDFTTRAGKKTNFYIDKYLFETRPDILDPLTSQLMELFPAASEFDRIAAPELGAVPLAAVLSVKLKKPYIIIKKETKGYGTNRKIEGKYSAGDRVVLLEDVLTTGGTALKACDLLTSEKMPIVSVIGVINRDEGADAEIEKRGLLLKSLFRISELHEAN